MPQTRLTSTRLWQHADIFRCVFSHSYRKKIRHTLYAVKNRLQQQWRWAQLALARRPMMKNLLANN